jgi:hypothetical protein
MIDWSIVRYRTLKYRVKSPQQEGGNKNGHA